MTRLVLFIVAVLLLCGQSASGQSLGERMVQSLFTSYGQEHKMLYFSGEYYTGLILPRLSAGELAPPRENNSLTGVAFALGFHANRFVSLGLGAETFRGGNPMNTLPILGFVELKCRPLIDLPRLQIHARASMLNLYRDRGSLDAKGNYSLSVGWDWHKGFGPLGFNPSVGISYMPYHTWRSEDGGAWITYGPKAYQGDTLYRGATWSLFVRLAFTLN